MMNHKRPITVAGLVLAVTVLFAACGSDQACAASSSKTTKATTRTTKKLSGPKIELDLDNDEQPAAC